VSQEPSDLPHSVTPVTPGRCHWREIFTMNGLRTPRASEKKIYMRTRASLRFSFSVTRAYAYKFFFTKHRLSHKGEKNVANEMWD
jgi:hypothetical protein